MLDVLDSDTAATQPAVKDDGFMEQVYGQICSEGQDGFGEDELGTFAAEMVGLPTTGSGGEGQVKTILRDISRGDERATLARLHASSVWRRTASELSRLERRPHVVHVVIVLCLVVVAF